MEDNITDTITGTVMETPIMEFHGPGEDLAEFQFSLRTEAGMEYGVNLYFNPMETETPAIRRGQTVKIEGNLDPFSQCIEMNWYEHIQPADPSQLPQQ